MKDSDKIEDVILRYLEGRMSSEDSTRLTQWLTEDDNNPKLLYKLEQSWHDNQKLSSRSREKVWERLSGDIQETTSSKGLTIAYKPFFRIASVLVIGFFIAVFLNKNLQSNEQQVRYIEKVSLPGQKVSVKLPDGSKIKLNAGSKLITPERFNPKEREVELVGEAYFEIAHDKSRPFVIKTGGLHVKVLGTSFNVRAYPEEESVQVAVTSGKVAVRCVGSTDPLELLPNEMATCNPGKNQFEITGFDSKKVLSWKNKTLYFKGENIKEIVQTLERWYGVSILIRKELDMKRDFSGEYHNKSLQTILDGLSYIYDFEYEINDESVIIK